MSIKRIETRPDRTIFHIEELTPLREPDTERTCVVAHDPMETWRLKLMSEAEMVSSCSSTDPGVNVQRSDLYEIPYVGTVVFLDDFDTDYYSSRYRHGAHQTIGPILLAETKIAPTAEDVRRYVDRASQAAWNEIRSHPCDRPSQLYDFVAIILPRVLPVCRGLDHAVRVITQICQFLTFEGEDFGDYARYGDHHAVYSYGITGMDSFKAQVVVDDPHKLQKLADSIADN